MDAPNNELISKFAQRLDDLIVLPSLLEMFDGKVFKFLLELLVEKYWDDIPTQYQDEVYLLMEGFANNDYSAITEATASAVNDMVDLPFASEDEEAQWIALNMQMLFKFVLFLKDKN